MVGAPRTYDQAWMSSTSCRVTIPTIRPYSSTRTAGEAFKYCFARATSTFSLTTGNGASMTCVTGACSSSRLSNNCAITRLSRTLPTGMRLQFIKQSERHPLFAQQSLLLHPFVGEEFRQVAFAGVADDEDDDVVFGQVLRYLQRGPCDRSGAASAEDSFLAPQPPRGVE